MAILVFLSYAAVLVASFANAAIVEHTFHIANMTARRLCEDKIITVVNGKLPGPTVEVTDGDTVVVHIINESPHALTIHWHGVTQLLNNWADGVSMITQCPIQPGNANTYQFNVTGQEGTLWWHAHVALLRVTVHGALVIRPREGTKSYPFPKPDKEVTIILGEWWKVNIVTLGERILDNNLVDYATAYTINGKPGDTYACSNGPNDTYKLDVEYGKTYLLRIINTALYNELFYKVANHDFTVVGVDASYTKPYKTDLIVIGPGQTVDALLVANAPPGRYYMAATAHETMSPPPPVWHVNTTSRGIVQYMSALPSQQPIMPVLPATHDNLAAYRFHTSLTGLLKTGERSTVPLQADETMFITLGIGSFCRGQAWCLVDNRLLLSYMNNVSFVLPRKMSLLEAHYRRVNGIYTVDFPDEPPLFYNFTDSSLEFHEKNENVDQLNKTLEFTSKGTKVKKFRYNTTVDIVLQGTSVIAAVGHEIHLHGHNFYVLAHGFGNYDAERAIKRYNLVDPPIRNTAIVPPNGWAVIRFVANNPGVWFVHCHMELHLELGMATAFVVENGPTSETSLPPPPADLPKCPSSAVVKQNGLKVESENNEGSNRASDS